jgi:hypothetical protein
MVQNPLTVLGVRRASSQADYDLPFLNRNYIGPQLITALQRLEAPRHGQLLFTDFFGGGVKPADQSMLQPIMQANGSEWIVFRDEVEAILDLRVVDVSAVPNIIVAGMPFEVSFNKEYIHENDLLIHENGVSVFIVHSKQVSSDGTTRATISYSAGYNLDNSLQTLPGGLAFQPNTAFTKGGNAQRTDGNQTYNPVYMPGDNYMDTLNVLSISAYELRETGSALADTTNDYAYVATIINKKGEQEDVKTMFRHKALRQVFTEMNYKFMYSTPNFSAKTRNFTTQGRGLYNTIPVPAGIYYQMDKAPDQDFIYASDTNGAKLRYLDRKFAQKKSLGFSSDLIAFGYGVGMQVMKDTLQAGYKELGIQLFQDVQDDMTLGFSTRKYQTINGSIRLVDLGSGQAQVGNFSKATYNGIVSDERSRNVYITPAMGGTMEAPKKLVQVMYKSGNGINRAFVMGTQRGMTGQTGALSPDQMLSMQESAAQSMLDNENNRVDTSYDGNKHFIMSHIAGRIDTMGMTRLRVI